MFKDMDLLLEMKLQSGKFDHNVSVLKTRVGAQIISGIKNNFSVLITI